MNLFSLKIYAADRPLYEGQCESLIIPSVDGQYGILAKHLNVILAVVPGVLTYKINEEVNTLSVSRGLVKIEDNEVLVLVDTAERPEEIDENRARLEASQAKEEMLQKRSVKEYYEAQTRLARAVNRLKVKHQYKNL